MSADAKAIERARWVKALRYDYGTMIPKPRRISRWRGTLRAWMAPGSDQTTQPVDEAA